MQKKEETQKVSKRVLLIADADGLNVGIQEIVGCITIFTFLLSLRIADDFKDYKTDIKLFPDRPLPSGRVKKTDLAARLPDEFKSTACRSRAVVPISSKLSL